MSDVYLVPSLKHNLMSVGKLTKHGYKVIFTGNASTFLDKFPSRKLIAKIKMTKNMMFPLTLNNVN